MGDSEQATIGAQQGTLVKWNDDRGFGFVAPDDGSPDVFVHITHFSRGVRRPSEGDKISYHVDESASRPKASEAELMGFKPPQWPILASGTASIAVFFFFAHLLGIVVMPFVLFCYLSLSLITFFVFWADKQRAEQGQWRMKEFTFHTLEILGGWPGALLAQQALRHKTQKSGYLRRFWVITAAHIVVWSSWVFFVTGQ